MPSLNLRDLERSSWRIARKDGLMDILFGVLFLAAALVGVLDQLQAASWIRITTLVVIQFSGVGATWWMRKRYVVPRLGRVKYSSIRVRKTRTMRVALAACVLVTALLATLTALSRRFGFAFLWELGDLGTWLIISAVILVPIGGLAVFLDYPRLWIYAGLFSAVEFLHVVIRFPVRVPFGAAIAYGTASSISLAVGIMIYVRFLRGVPRLAAAGNPLCEEGRHDA